MKYTLTEDFGAKWKAKKNQNMFLQIGSLSIDSVVSSFNKKTVSFNLSRPACVSKDSMIIICTKEDGTVKIVGYGSLKSGNKLID